MRVKRQVPAQSSSNTRPREWLALADGAVQEARTEGTALALVGQPLPYQPGRAERRSGVPAEVITSDRVPNCCICSWSYSQGRLTLKHYNAACPVHIATLVANVGTPLDAIPGVHLERDHGAHLSGSSCSITHLLLAAPTPGRSAGLAAARTQTPAP